VKVDRKVVALFVSPIIAVAVCTISSLVLPGTRNFHSEQPEFLAYVDQLSLFTIKDENGPVMDEVRDVFRHEWIEPVLPAPMNETVVHNTGGVLPEPVTVSMIVGADRDAYCVINGRKMRPGDKTEKFKLSSIGSNSVSITRTNGTRETLNVKAY